MSIIRAKNMEEVKKYIDSIGTLNTAQHAFNQKKPVFVVIPDYLTDDIEELIKEVEE